MINKKRGQVWVETVIYTLIGLAIIGLVISAIKPKIDQRRDKIIIEQSIEAMHNLNEKIYEVQRASWNRRIVDIKVGRGTLTFDIDKSEIKWEIDSSYEYSELDYPVKYGVLTILTQKGSPYKVTLSMNYSTSFNYEGKVSGKYEFQQASIPYKLLIENKGVGADSGCSNPNNICLEFRQA